MKTIGIPLLAICLLFCMNVSAKTAAQDTLRIIREDEFLHDPFGIVENLKSFENTHKELLSIKQQSVRPYKNSRKEPTKMFVKGKSSVRFYLDQNSKKLETVAAIILDGNISLQNGVAIGAEKAEFLKKLNIPDEDAVQAASIIELTSKGGDIHHYYNFQDNKLIRITIFSYLFYQK